MAATQQDQPVDSPHVGLQRRFGRVRFFAIAAAVLLILVAADDLLSNREMDHLLDAVQASEAPMRSANTDIDVAAGRLTPTADAQTRNEALNVVSARCGTAATDVQAAGALVESVGVLPWHRKIRTAKAAYLAHNRVWRDAFAACADDAPQLAKPSRTAQIAATWRVAQRSFRAALPAVALGQSDRRVQEIFGE
ncbi:hypothetical protein ACPPVT_14400 [Angustibacter sp. McL0619]|uniref:hypothetical protein n=1 Tax=Angustibacter sp. McL0619 TaxID=3415676 RepID=UPI003CEFD173